MCRNLVIPMVWDDENAEEDCEGTFVSPTGQWGPNDEVILHPEFEEALRSFLDNHSGCFVHRILIRPAGAGEP